MRRILISSFYSGALLLVVFPMVVFSQRIEKVFDVVWQGTVAVPVSLRLDNNGQPDSYTTRFMAEVCSDGLCRPVDIYIDWDLLGNFKDYRTPEENPLTKFDHVPFSHADHQKLRKILSDKRSLLQDYEADDLIDRSTKVFSETTDAVTGATSPTFENAIVSGAVYTVHTLWRFVNGEAAVRMGEHTVLHMTDTLLQKMIRSGYEPYLHFSLEYLTEQGLTERFIEDLIRLIRVADDYIPHMAIRQIPEQQWERSAVQVQVLGLLDEVDETVQNTLLNRFSASGLSNEGIGLLLGKLTSLADRQAGLAFQVLNNQYQQISGQHREILSKLSIHPRGGIAAGAEALLKKTR